MMNTQFEKIKNFRIVLLKQIETLTIEQLNEIPTGYNNNIIWNLGHLLAAEQNVCYVKSGLPIAVEDEYFSPFMPGTKPEYFSSVTTVSAIKKLLITSIDQLQSDFEANKFSNYTPSLMVPKVYGFEINDINSALEYLLYHEGLHAGYILAMKRLL